MDLIPEPFCLAKHAELGLFTVILQTISHLETDVSVSWAQATEERLDEAELVAVFLQLGDDLSPWTRVVLSRI